MLLNHHDPNNFGYLRRIDHFVLQGKKKDKKVVWILDSGCLRHMTGDKIMLSLFVEKADPLVTFGDNKNGYTMGYDNLEIRNVVIFYVALVEGLKHNLLSIGQFTDRGFMVKFDKDKCLIIWKKYGEVSLTGVREGSLFVANMDSTNKNKIYYFYSKTSNEDGWL